MHLHRARHLDVSALYLQVDALQIKLLMWWKKQPMCLEMVNEVVDEVVDEVRDEVVRKYVDAVISDYTSTIVFPAVPHTAITPQQQICDVDEMSQLVNVAVSVNVSVDVSVNVADVLDTSQLGEVSKFGDMNTTVAELVAFYELDEAEAELETDVAELDEKA